jgi:hypothetical protein
MDPEKDPEWAEPQNGLDLVPDRPGNDLAKLASYRFFLKQPTKTQKRRKKKKKDMHHQPPPTPSLTCQHHLLPPQEKEHPHQTAAPLHTKKRPSLCVKNGC